MDNTNRNNRETTLVPVEVPRAERETTPYELYQLHCLLVKTGDNLDDMIDRLLEEVRS